MTDPTKGMRIRERYLWFLRMLTHIDTNANTMLVHFKSLAATLRSYVTSQGVNDVSDEALADFCRMTILEVFNFTVPISPTIQVYQITVTAHPNTPPREYEAASTFDDQVFSAKTMEHVIGKIAKHINPKLDGADSKVVTTWLQQHVIIKLEMSSI